MTVQAYRDFLAAGSAGGGLEKEVEAALRRLPQQEATPPPPEVLDSVSETIRAAFRKRALPEQLKAEIASLMRDILGGFEYVAVRSSATCEDLPDASFAGQHDTYLNVLARDVENVCRHVVDCFSSLFTSRAISYRVRNGLPHTGEAVGMAVVVQAMVMSEASGVLFTANPLTGRRTESVLEAIPGLGEALVSGLTEPDRYVVARRAGDDKEGDGSTCSIESIEILDTRIGAKLKSIRPVDGGGVIEESTGTGGASHGDTGAAATPTTATMKPVLSDETVLELVELGQKIVNLYGGRSQDIEWARSTDGKIYVVQSRPITTLFPLPDPPVPGEKASVYGSFGAIQGFSDPIYPSGQDAVKSLMYGGIAWLSWGRFGTGNGGVRVVAERVYANVTTVVRNPIGRKVFPKLLRAAEPGTLAGLEQEVFVNPAFKVESGVSPVFFVCALAVLSKIVPRFIFSIVFPDRARQDYIDTMEKLVNKVESEAQAANNLRDVVILKEQAFGGTFPVIIPNAVPRIAAGNVPLLLIARIASTVPDGNDLVLTITRGLPHNVTTEMDLKLWDVAKTIRGDKQSFERFRSHDADALAADYLDECLPSPAQDAIRPFMALYGVRGLCEIDFGRPRWRERPSQLMQTLKSYVEIDEERAPCKVFAEGEKAAEQAIEHLGKETNRLWLVKFLARRVRALAGLRELHKFTIVRFSGILREKYLQEGNKLVQDGILDDAHSIFFLHDDELKELAENSGRKARDWKALVADRKATLDRESERTRVPRILLSDGFAYYGGSTKLTPEQENNPNILVGEPVSPGTVEGTVRVVHDPSKTTLRPGEVLVCHGTDPSWTPLFLSACSLVMEVGGLMTHGSVVAREYGIPAVVGIEKVTERLRTGQRIRVDGSSGVLEVLDSAE